MRSSEPRVVVVPIIPGGIPRGAASHVGLDYAEFSLATWRWWCERNGVHLVVLDEPQGGENFSGYPPTVQRWCAVRGLLERFGPHARLCFVDADTMVRWDTPDFFGLAGDSFGAVLDPSTNWIQQSIRAYQPLFPDVRLQAASYFNSGFVVLGAAHLPVIDTFLSWVSRNRDASRAIWETHNAGTDQTPMNFICRQLEVPVRYLSWKFNRLHCFSPGWYEKERRIGRELWPPILLSLLDRVDRFRFTREAYVWHFTSRFEERTRLMADTWRHVRRNYPPG